MLPVVSGKPSELTLELNVPQHARSPEAGLYLEGQRLASFDEATPLKATLPALSEDRVRLELRCAGWVPRQVIPGSKDPRTLGVQVFSVSVRTADAEKRIFDANTGKWMAPLPAERK